MLHKEETNQSEDEEESSEEEETSLHTILRPSKGFKPEDHMMDPNIMRYKTTVLNHMKTELAQHTHPRFNTTKGERRVIKSLKRNQDIVIKPADKGGAIVIQDLADYIKEGEHQLMKKEHYTSPLGLH